MLRVQGSGFRVQVPLSRVQGPEFEVQGSEFQGSWFDGLGFDLRLKRTGAVRGVPNRGAKGKRRRLVRARLATVAQPAERMQIY